jgi:FMN phosphatase YigB (HAD superfamily)/DNA-binding XRE family transcriptional regulator
MAMDEKGLGKRLQEARKAAGLTQQELVAKANLSFSTLTKVERGAIKAPSIFTVQSIAETLGLSLDELVGLKPASGKAKQKTRSGASFVYFDVNGCLVYFYQGAFNKIAAVTGVRPDEVESAFWHFNDDVCSGQITIEEFNTRFGERLGTDKIVWQDYYLDTVQPIQEMQELLKWAAEHYRVGLMTNIMPGLLDSMLAAGILPQLDYDVVLDSSSAKAIKPEPEIYQIAEERAGLPPEEILFIDDSRVNLMAAEKLGWKVLWFDDSHPREAAERLKEALEPSAN